MARWFVRDSGARYVVTCSQPGKAKENSPTNAVSTVVNSCEGRRVPSGMAEPIGEQNSHAFTVRYRMPDLFLTT
jgi:hypothetical protein